MNIQAKRFLALLIDVFTWGVACSVILIVTAVLSIPLPQYKTMRLVLFVLELLFLLREPLHLAFGKKLMKIKVVDANGNDASWRQHFIRNLLLFIWPVEAVLVLTGSNRLGDMLAKTKVEAL